MRTIIRLFERYKDFILYAVFGVCTTIANTVVYWLCAHPLGLPVVVSAVIAWFCAVLLAYLTNRRLVFHSEAKENTDIAKELVRFYACRIATGMCDCLCMYILVKRLHLPDVPMKLGSNILVIVLNFIASKFVVFSHK